MKAKEKYPFLYYKPPVENRYALDPPIDEEEQRQFRKYFVFEKQLRTVPLKELIEFIIFTLKDDMPEMVAFLSCLHEQPKIEQLGWEAIYNREANDISLISEEWVNWFDKPDPMVTEEIDGHLFDFQASYTKTIAIEFAEEQPELMKWVKDNLTDKETHTDGDTLIVKNSPILSVTCTANTLSIQLDRAAFRSYF
jgi:hypothetical protein